MDAAIFCPNCQRYLGLQMECETCHWVRPARPAAPVSHVHWKVHLSEAGSFTDSTIYLTQITSNGKLLFVPTAGGELAALNPADGLEKWRRALHPEHLLRVQSAALWGDVLLLGAENLASLPANERCLLAWDAETGAELWSWSAPGDNLSVPVVAGDVAYFTSSEPILFALDLPSRSLRWQVPAVTWSPDAPVVGSGVVVVPARGSSVAAFAEGDGHRLWSFTADEPESEVLHLHPALSADTAFLAGWDKRLYAVDLTSGKLRWRFTAPRGITAPPVLAGERLLVAVKDLREKKNANKPGYSLCALDQATGDLLWKFSTERHIYTRPQVVGDTVLFGADDRRLHILDLASGEELWQFPAAGKVQVSPCVLDGKIFFGQQDYTIYALQWQEEAQQPLERKDLLALEEGAQLALDGQFAAAGQWYRAQGDYQHAAALFMQANQPQEAAEDYLHLGDLERLLEVRRQVGDRTGEAEALALLGKHAEAARLFEASGQLDRAVREYSQAGRTGYAAMLLWQNGRRKEAADLYHSINQDDKAAEVLVEDGRFAEAAEIYLRIQKPEVAAGVLAQGGLLERAADLYAQTEHTRLAAELYTKAGLSDPALRLYESLADWSKVAEVAEQSGDLLRLAKALTQLGQLERAAQVYQRAGQLDTSIELYLQLGKWERVAALAGELGDGERQGFAFSQLGLMTQAGEAYEQAARQAQQEHPEDTERIASLYEAAAKYYGEDDDWLRQSACYNKVCQIL